MLNKFKQIVENLNRPKTYLVLGNLSLVIFLIMLSNLGVVPIKNLGDFIFFAFIALALALYRPGWAFLLFVGTIVLENVSLAPEQIGLTVRPYQLLGGLTILALGVRLVAGRLNFKLLKLKWFDYFAILLTLAGFVSALGSADKGASLKLSVILATFVAFYFLARNFVATLEDLKRLIPFFLSSAIVVVIYGIWQNVRFMQKLASFEVMLGRPNGTFAESDWLGIYLTLLIGAVYAIIFYLNSKSREKDLSEIYTLHFTIYKQFSISKFKILKVLLYSLLVAAYVLLILTVSRSAWLGVFVSTFIFLLAAFTDLKLKPKTWAWKSAIQNKLGIIFSLLLAIGVVYVFHLTSFQLLNRVQSTASGLQKITIACKPGSEAPEKISVVEELEKTGCRLINLESIEKEIGKNNLVREIYRDDPNVSIRSEIYEKSWGEINKHPMLGIGWGSIAQVLGQDARGAGLNASNIFLEVWLGSGLVGFLAFLVLWVYVFVRALQNFVHAQSLEQKVFALFILSAWFGLTVANLFNAGILLGFFWLFLAISFIDLQKNENRH